jgi:ATP-dependent RNA helicase HelY
VVGRLALPAPFAPKNRDFQRRVAASLAASGETPEERPGRGTAGRGAEAAGRLAVARCPDLRAHLRAAVRAERLAYQVERLERQVQGRTESLARQFDRVLQLLERWRYVDGWSLAPAGTRLARIYHEQDLLVAECAERGILDGLRPAEMAGLVSVFTYEARGPFAAETSTARWPGHRLEERWRAVQAVARELAEAEEAGGLPATRSPDPGFATLACGWAQGKELSHLLVPVEVPGAPRASGISAGDFVRNVKQLIDLLRQLGEVLPDEGSAANARRGADALFRGVVAAPSVLGAAGSGGPES